MDQTFASPAAGSKRRREVEADDIETAGYIGKKARQTVDQGSHSWQQDSVISTPSASSQQPKTLHLQATKWKWMIWQATPSPLKNSALFRKLHQQAPVPGEIACQLQTTGIKHHIRQRHPQENSSDRLEVPSPIDEDEVPTPPSAAEAAGSQLSMLSMDDMDVEQPGVPTITVDPARTTPLDAGPNGIAEHTDSGGGPAQVIVRKQRQRSGATSNGSASPARTGGGMESAFGGPSRKGISIGYRADCEKCRMRVPGHMNHFIS
ncbi:hypothetical protein KC337_g13799 [Hortaea werneckii]|nr:hypothetical protein KC337_g13799 [Hortaea werneckii]